MVLPTLLQPLRLYALPLVLFSAGLFFQLVVLPSSFPTSHYDILGVRRLASVSEVEGAYQELYAKWSSGSDVPTVDDFIKIRYALELLTDPLWKRDYDYFGIDEHLHVIAKLKDRYSGGIFSKIKLPILDTSIPDFSGPFYNKLVDAEFNSDTAKAKAWLIQVYSSGSPRCAEFSNSWNRIVNHLDGVVDTGVVELGEHEMSSFLAERRYTGQPFFRNGLPSLVAFSPNCGSLDCCMRYDGELSEDAVVDWMATTVLGLPQIFYYTKESLDQHFIAKSGRHKVKVILFSKTGQRALPFLRKASKDYHAYASFAFILWRDEDSSIWFNTLQVESAPAIVFLKDPGVKPVIHYGTWNSSFFANIMEQNKYHDLPQLRSVTSMELGCDARGISRAGNDTAAWYCVILAGRPSLQLNLMRETMRRVQNKLTENDSSISTKDDSSVHVPAVHAFKNKRLTLAWLDGQLQDKYCTFYLHSETSYETCGSRRFADVDDVPRLFLVRYGRNFTEKNLKVEKKMKSVWDTFQEADVNLASQLVARYNGSEDISEIVQWISQTIKDGDSRDLPYFRAENPELIPEDADPVFLKNIRVISNGGAMKKRLQIISTSIYDRMTDPRLGPLLLLGACISFGTIILQRNQSNSQVKKAEGGSPRKKVHKASGDDWPASITDTQPKDGRQIMSSDSDTE